MTKWLIALLATGALLAGCSKDEGGGGAKGDSVGVAECDDYIKKMEACFSKDPATKTAAEPGLKQMKEAWKTAAAQGGAAKDALKTGCTSAAAAIPPSC